MDWPAFATKIEVFQKLHDNFEDVKLSHIPQNWNVRTYMLAKDAKTRGYTFSYRSVPDI